MINHICAALQIPDFSVTVEVLPCALGEVPKFSGASCQRCDQQVFRLWSDPRASATPLLADALAQLNGTAASNSTRGLSDWLALQDSVARSSNLVCEACPANSKCMGGAVVVPVAGYWHSAPNATYAHRCPQPAACRSSKPAAQDALLACQVRPLGMQPHNRLHV